MADSGWARRRQQWELTIEREAMQLFAAEGMDAITVRRIADASGISERTFYRYFPAKEDILWARPMRVVGELPGALTRRPSGETLLEAFRQAGLEVLSVFTDEPQAWVVWTQVVRATAPTTTRMMRGDQNPFFVALEAAIASRLDDPNGSAPGVLATALSGTIAFALSSWVEADGHADLGALFDDAIVALARLQESATGLGVPIAGAALTR